MGALLLNAEAVFTVLLAALLFLIKQNQTVTYRSVLAVRRIF